ncbi:MAG TPA: FKBP-type peptidyl-prolyl cis-trans isomerase [Bdellovibrio sp.]
MEYEPFIAESESPIFSTFQQKQSQTITLGQTQHIPGIEKALLGMKPGGRRWVRIPWILGYGWQGGAGGFVPPRADLEAVIELKSSDSVN